VATDADLAGQVAAERDFWLLTPHSLDPDYARFPDGMDPSELLTLRGPAALAAALHTASPLGDMLLTERLDHLPPEHARLAAAKIVAARPSSAWDAGTSRVSARLRLSQMQARRDLRDALRAWNTDPRRAAAEQLADSTQIRARLQFAGAQTPAKRWASLAGELDPRLVTQTDWPATAAILQDAHDQGHDVATAARALVAERPLGSQPARDLRYRLVSRLDVTINTGEDPISGATVASTGAARERLQRGQTRTTPNRGPRR
jgi:DNA primase